MLNVREKNYSHTSSCLIHQNFFTSQLLGLYEDGNWSPGNAYIYVTLIYNLRSCNLTLMYNRRTYNLLDVTLIHSLVFHGLGLYEPIELNNPPSPASLWPSTPCSSSTLPRRTFSDRTTRCWSSSPSRASSSSPTGRWVAGRLVHNCTILLCSLAYLIIVTDATDAVSVNFFGRWKSLQI